MIDFSTCTSRELDESQQIVDRAIDEAKARNLAVTADLLKRRLYMAWARGERDPKVLERHIVGLSTPAARVVL